MRPDRKSFHLVNLSQRSDVMRRISETESDLQELLDTPVALIAYLEGNDGNEKNGTEKGV
ncbi:hypothetical protein [Desmospora activa]|uniref:Uncharacterized protein n=1 Tax=Desmospora activa DSM 45169 TaxID=1121389 RepID=A0A2T4ZBU2_9BACL|nr:hypothetical protein [Desmospora activa]PTM59326.1 hypothetical protein C8J48_1938 [Desmospora activa DSM 45169]